MKPKNKNLSLSGTKAEASKVERKKSKLELFWELNPHGILEIVNMKAVLK
ncbi:hypothetical protein [Viscerimonas tarda]